jgi:hypothetical protein
MEMSLRPPSGTRWPLHTILIRDLISYVAKHDMWLYQIMKSDGVETMQMMFTVLMIINCPKLDYASRGRSQ